MSSSKTAVLSSSLLLLACSIGVSLRDELLSSCSHVCTLKNTLRNSLVALKANYSKRQHLYMHSTRPASSPEMNTRMPVSSECTVTKCLSKSWLKAFQILWQLTQTLTHRFVTLLSNGKHSTQALAYAFWKIFS